MDDPFTQNAEIKRKEGRPRKSNAVNSWETKNNVSRVKFEHASCLVRELQYLTYHGNEDRPSVDAFLCIRDGVTPDVKFGELNERKGGPKFFIQATPNYPVEKIAEFFLQIGLDMCYGRTNGDNWEMVSSGYDLLDRLFGADKAKTLARLKKGNNGAKAAVPVLGPGYDDLKDRRGNVATRLIAEWPTNQEWQEKFKHWGPNGILDEEQSSSPSGLSSSLGTSRSSGSSRSRSSRSSSSLMEASRNPTGTSAVVSNRDSQLASSNLSPSKRRHYLMMKCRLQLERSKKIMSGPDSNDNHN